MAVARLCVLALPVFAGCASHSAAGASAKQSADASARSVDASVHATDAAVDAALPAAFKGYELYAWDERGDVSYTLITGTNRQKMLAEITAQMPDVQDGGDWVVIHGRGLSSLERLLARVPAGTDVILTELAGLPPLSDAHRQAVARLLRR